MTDGNMGVGKSNVLTKKSSIKKIKKSDWVVVRLLVEGASINPQGSFRSREYVNAVVYLLNKYGTDKTDAAIATIRKERGLE